MKLSILFGVGWVEMLFISKQHIELPNMPWGTVYFCINPSKSHKMQYIEHHNNLCTRWISNAEIVYIFRWAWVQSIIHNHYYCCFVHYCHQPSGFLSHFAPDRIWARFASHLHMVQLFRKEMYGVVYLFAVAQTEVAEIYFVNNRESCEMSSLWTDYG